jgi:inhibitor of KinA sporulation pathway (predicted exonuclease)
MSNHLSHAHALYLDLEWTCWDAPPPPGMRQEIIEIGIVEMDLLTLAVTEEASYFIRPRRWEISPMCTRLTGITSEDISKAMIVSAMTDELIKKLSLELREPITHERQVVYILVLVRKMLDRLGETTPDEYLSLRLYCDWVVHLNLYFRQARTIVRDVDALYPKLVAETEADDRTEFLGRYTFKQLRQELNAFLTANDLSPFDDAAWKTFAPHLMGVIADCPLTCRSPNSPVTEVDEVVLTRKKNPDRIVWQFGFKGRHKHEIETNIGPAVPRTESGTEANRDEETLKTNPSLVE